MFLHERAWSDNLREFLNYRDLKTSKEEFPLDKSFFTTFLVENRRIYLWEKHIERITQNAKYFNVSLEDEWHKSVLTHLRKRQESSIRCRLSFPIDKNIQGICALDFSPKPDFKKWKLMTKQKDSFLAECFLKIGDYQNEIAQMKKLQQSGYDDFLFFDQHQNLLETSISNILLKINGEWLTPVTRPGILKGVSISYLIDKKAIKEAPLQKSDLGQATNAFCCNSVRGFVPLESIDQITYSGLTIEHFDELLVPINQRPFVEV